MTQRKLDSFFLKAIDKNKNVQQRDSTNASDAPLTSIPNRIATANDSLESTNTMKTKMKATSSKKHPRNVPLASIFNRANSKPANSKTKPKTTSKNKIKKTMTTTTTAVAPKEYPDNVPATLTSNGGTVSITNTMKTTSGTLQNSSQNVPSVTSFDRVDTVKKLNATKTPTESTNVPSKTTFNLDGTANSETVSLQKHYRGVLPERTTIDLDGTSKITIPASSNLLNAMAIDLGEASEMTITELTPPSETATIGLDGTTINRDGTVAPVTFSDLRYNSKKHRLGAPPVHLSCEEACIQLKVKLHLDDALKLAKTNEEEATIGAVQQLLHQFLYEHVYETDGTTLKPRWRWNPQSLTELSLGGVYAAITKNPFPRPPSFKPGSSDSQMHGRTKRIKENGFDFLFAVTLMDTETCRKNVPCTVIQDILDMELPSLQFHPSHTERLKDSISHWTCETVVGCIYRCVNYTLGERFVKLPTKRIRSVMARPQYHPDAIDFAKNISKAPCNLTWPTLGHRLYEIAKDSPNFLPHKLRDMPPDGGFVTLNQYQQLLGKKYGGFKNAVGCPREAQVEDVVKTLLPLLSKEKDEEGSTSNVSKIRKALAPLQGNMKSHYVRPPQKELADGAQALLKERLDTLSGNDMLFTEWVSIEAIKEYYSKWYQSQVGTSIDHFPACLGEPEALSLVQTKANGIRLAITRSFFSAFAENVTLEQRIRSIRSFVVNLHLMHDSGHISDDAFNQQYRIIQAFLMGLLFGEGKRDFDVESNYREARYRAFPKGYFLGNRRDIKVVSDPLGIGYLEALLLRERLGQERFQKLLIAHDLLLGGQQTISPMEPSFVCPGLPAFAGMEAKPCTATVDDRPYIQCVGSKSSHKHCLYGYFCCQRCHRGLEKLERSYLSQRPQDSLTNEEQKRLTMLETRHENHATQTAVSRLKRVVKIGEVAVVEKDRTKHLKSQDRQADDRIADPEIRKAESDKNAEKERKRLANGGAPKKSGRYRKIRSLTLTYDQDTRELLKQGVQFFIKNCGKKHIFINELDRFLDMILVEAKDSIKFFKRGKPDPTMKLEFTDEGEVRALAEEYKLVCSPYIKDPRSSEEKGKSKQWMVHDEHKPSSEQLEEAREIRAKVESKHKKEQGVDFITFLFLEFGKQSAAADDDENSELRPNKKAKTSD